MLSVGLQEEAMNRVEQAKDVLTKNANVLYGIFGVIAESGYFPPLPFLNEFFMVEVGVCDRINQR